MLNSVVRQQIHALPKGSSAKTTRQSISESVNQIKVWPRVQMLRGQTGLTPQIIHSIPRVLDRPQHSDQVPRAMLFFPAPEIVPKVSHRFSNTRIIHVSTSESIFGKSTFSPQRLTYHSYTQTAEIKRKSQHTFGNAAYCLHTYNCL